MDKDRFNTLLANLDKITDTDIKSLNRLRKQYPYFQSQYVMIARALKARNHPKTDAFIKKAAIYSADRALLKSIIMDEHSFAAVEAPAEETEVITVEVPTTKEEVIEVENAIQPEQVAEVTTTESHVAELETIAIPENINESAEENTAHTPDIPEVSDTPTDTTEEAEEVTIVTEEGSTVEALEETVVTAPSEESTEAEAQAPESIVEASATDTEAQEENDKVIDDLARDLLEIRIKKQLIAKMLEQQEAKQSVKKPKESKKKAPSAKTSQSELIEKFIRNEPQMGKQKLAEAEGEYTHKDLAARFVEESDDFHTETMAKLMVLQKKYKKAIHIYEKLGLKFPEKSAFFASQIEKVKEKSNG